MTVWLLDSARVAGLLSPFELVHRHDDDMSGWVVQRIGFISFFLLYDMSGFVNWYRNK